MKLFVAMILLVATYVGAAALDVPRLQGRVNDYAAVLTSTQRQDVERRLTAIETKTSAQVVYLIVKTLEKDDIEQFTKKVFASWRLGQASKNNGVLVVIAQDERKIRIVPGRGLEGVLPDAECWSIIRKIMAPRLSRGNEDYFAAVSDSVDRIQKLIYEEATPLSKPISETNNANEGTLILFGIVMIVAAFAGMFHFLAGGVVGGLGSALVAGMIFGGGAAIAGLVIGGLLGCVARFFLDVILQVGLGGSSSGGGSFSGGGGIELGGGASDDF